jgi:hypothetical protein
MNERRKFLKGIGLVSAVAVGAITATRVQIENKNDIDPEIRSELEETDMSGSITFVSDYNGIKPEATWKVGRDGKMYLKENNQWRRI